MNAYQCSWCGRIDKDADRDVCMACLRVGGTGELCSKPFGVRPFMKDGKTPEQGTQELLERLQGVKKKLNKTKERKERMSHHNHMSHHDHMSHHESP